ncbi:MAG: hypothetical protein WC254_03470 [Candidatus Woesearchaeota archaeon]|jgi:hypothetical protein
MTKDKEKQYHADLKIYVKKGLYHVEGTEYCPADKESQVGVSLSSPHLTGSNCVDSIQDVLSRLKAEHTRIVLVNSMPLGADRALHHEEILDLKKYGITVKKPTLEHHLH